MGEVHGPFAEWINERLERIGPVFMRPKVHAVQPNGVGRLIAYIHRNPVRAGIVPHPSDSDWTSHRAYLRPDSAPPWLDVSKGLELSGFPDGHALCQWIDSNAIAREDVDADLLDQPAPMGRPPKTRNPPEQEAGFDFVAGAGFEPATFGL